MRRLQHGKDFGMFRPGAMKAERPIPGSEAQLKTVKELIDLVDLSEDEKNSTKANLPNLMTDTAHNKIPHK